MPISKEEKAKTRLRILKQAAALFRRKGYHGVGIDKIMGAAQLTRGGFYSHFRSKSALFVEVLKQDHGLPRLLAARRGRTAKRLREEALRVIEDYLKPQHRREVANGCTLSALAFDAARIDRSAQRAYEGKIREVAEQYARCREDASSEDPNILAAVVLTIGGLTIARAMGDSPLSAKLSDACREQVEMLLS